MRRRVAYERETTVVLGGHPHFVYASGASDSSVILLCHGGPGYSELPMIRAGAYARLQEDLLLVTGDQRGTGRSYSDAIEPEMLTVGRLLDDAIELLDWVRNTFQRDKLQLLGHSWGGCLASCSPVAARRRWRRCTRSVRSSTSTEVRLSRMPQ